MSKEQKLSFWDRHKKSIVTTITVLAAITAILSFWRDLFFDNPVTQAIERMEKNAERVLQLQSVEIPDSLCDAEIEKMKACQQRILYYAKLFSNTEISPSDSLHMLVNKSKIIIESNRQMNRDFLYTISSLELDRTGLDSLAYFQLIASDCMKTLTLWDKCGDALNKSIDRANHKPELALRIWMQTPEFQATFESAPLIASKFYEYLNILQLEQAYHLQNVKRQFDTLDQLHELLRK